MASKPIVVGIDIGAAESYVAYVGKGVVDIVQNEVSKRATASMVGFTDRERLLGDSALAKVRSNAKNTCRNFKHLLGRKIDAADVKIEDFWSTCPLCECADGHAGYDINYKGEQKQMSAIEVTAMYLTQLRGITEKWCEGKVTDVVLSVPSSFADVQRQALLDAAKVANMSVLRLMNEHTATALAYGIYRSNDFDPEKPMTVAFCSIGQSIFSVSIVQFIRGKLSVLCERNDKVGGRELDECLMREFSAQFKKKVGCDPLTNKKAAFKLEDAVMKTKKILSANNEAGITCECLMEDEDFASHVTRADLEKMCEPAMERAKKVLESALAASGLSKEQIDNVEVVGGGSRVPWVKRLCTEAFGKETLSTTMNQEESVARGAALQAAILSPLYKVRDFKVEDTTPYGINIGWQGAGAMEKGEKSADGDVDMFNNGAEGEYKVSPVFPAGSMINSLKMMTFYRKGPFDIKAEYADPSILPPGTPKELGTFRIELSAQPEAKKVKVRAKLTLHGTFVVEGAQMVEEEEYEEIVKEKRELPQEAPAEPEAPAEGGEAAPENGTAPMETETNGTNGNGNSAEGDAKPAEGENGEKKEPEKKYEWVDVKKIKKRTKKTDLTVAASGTPGLSEEVIQRLMDSESAMQAEMREIVETDEKRNDLESYIFNMQDRICAGNVYGDFISEKDREAFNGDLTKAQDWLYDNEAATKIAYIDKLYELKRTGDAVVWRCKEAGMRDEWVQAVKGTITNYQAAADTPGDKFGHIAAEKLGSIVSTCKELEAWLTGLKGKQDALAKHEKPVLICAEMEKKNQELAKMADDILKEPKPAPPAKEPEAPPKEEEEEAKDEEMKPAEEEAKAEEPADAD